MEVRVTTDERPLSSDAESDREGAFRSFGALAGGELTFSYQRDPRGPWELRHGDELVGVVDRPSEMVRAEAGSWRVEVARRLLGWQLTLRPIGRPGPLASYVPRHVLPGGTIALSDERSYKLRAYTLFAQGWTLSDAHGTELVRVRPAAEGWAPGEWVVDLSSGVADQPEAPLVVLTTCYAILVDQAQRPSSTG